MRKFILFIGFISLAVLSHAQYKSQVWVSDQGDGTYVNPVINADYSDPDACAVDGNFYMTASSFNCTPGLPILHSTDLVNWRIINYAIKDVEPADYYASPRHGKGVWAPSIRHHNGEFYIYWGDPDFGIFMVKTKDIYGEWEKPVLVKAGKGMIDPCPLWDEDGKVYLAHAWAGSRAGFNSIITVCEMNSEGTAIVSAPVMVFDGNDGTNHTIEGAKFYKRNGYYYIFAPAGGVATGWQLVLRSKSVYGPYEPRIVMAHGKTDINGPHQGAWVDTPSGESWFLHFQDKGAYGRVLHLNPMEWKSDWPVIGIDNDGDGCGDPVTAYRKPRTEGKNVIETHAISVCNGSGMPTITTSSDSLPTSDISVFMDISCPKTIHHITWLFTILSQVNASTVALIRDMPTIVCGHVVRHGLFMAIQWFIAKPASLSISTLQKR